MAPQLRADLLSQVRWKLLVYLVWDGTAFKRDVRVVSKASSQGEQGGSLLISLNGG